MASGIFLILDDIALLMDDVVSMSKLATKKTAGILGDDLAVNAEKATGFVSSRELPVLWKITKGSFLNKLIILPAVFLLNYFLPQAITIILVLGGIFLAYEGAIKIIETLFLKSNAINENKNSQDEATKIKSAITIDFILSVEIIIIALSTVLEKSLLIQILSVSVVALIATVGVYGLVAILVRMDDFGLYLIQKSTENSFINKIGVILTKALPWIIKTLSILGTIALLLVSGGIFVHKSLWLQEVLPFLPSILKELFTGLIVGSLVSLIVLFSKNIRKKL
jgi:predicted DNA repair protein MutK